MEILQADPVLESNGVELVSFTYEAGGRDDTDDESAAPQPANDDVTTEEVSREDLDDFEPGTYLCRWPNGDFSVVEADTKRGAIVALDECRARTPVADRQRRQQPSPRSRRANETQGTEGEMISPAGVCGS